LSEQLLTPYYWNSTAWASDGISILHIDTTAHRITFQVWHLSEFAFFSRPPQNIPSYLYFPVVTNRSDPAVVLEAAESVPNAAERAPAEEMPGAAEPAPPPEVDAPVDEPAPEEVATPDAAKDEAETPVAEETAAPEETSTDEAALPAPDASQRLHLPVIVR
ncbi:MAG: hypothetical protein KDE24_34135, partial [Caldilinea sp.]|nr:hypothetical protein [Caldilinea sp.]